MSNTDTLHICEVDSPDILDLGLMSGIRLRRRSGRNGRLVSTFFETRTLDASFSQERSMLDGLRLHMFLDCGERGSESVVLKS